MGTVAFLHMYLYELVHFCSRAMIDSVTNHSSDVSRCCDPKAAQKTAVKHKDKKAPILSQLWPWIRSRASNKHDSCCGRDETLLECRATTEVAGLGPHTCSRAYVLPDECQVSLCCFDVAQRARLTGCCNAAAPALRHRREPSGE